MEVVYGSQSAMVPPVVVDTKDQAPPLFGRNWLQHFKLDWWNLLPLSAQHRVSTLTIEDLKFKYADMFPPGSGTVKGVKATLHVKDEARPIFHKTCPVPFMLCQVVDDELQCMQDEDIIYPADFSEWATRLVCVPKPNGKVRLCRDYKVTVNTVLHKDQHPILKRYWLRLLLGRNCPKLTSEVHARSTC